MAWNMQYGGMEYGVIQNMVQQNILHSPQHNTEILIDKLRATNILN